MGNPLDNLGHTSEDARVPRRVDPYRRPRVRADEYVRPVHVRIPQYKARSLSPSVKHHGYASCKGNVVQEPEADGHPADAANLGKPASNLGRPAAAVPAGGAGRRELGSVVRLLEGPRPAGRPLADADRVPEVAAPRTWLLSKAWRRTGLVGPAEVPGG